MAPANDKRRAGFTLIELSVVLVILAIAATSVAIRYRSVLAGGSYEDAIDRIVRINARARSSARRQDRPMRLEFDLSAGKITLVDPATGRPGGPAERFGDTLRLARLQLAETTASAGTVQLAVSRQGWTPDYAIAIEEPLGRQEWLVASGLTGAIWRQENDPRLDERQDHAETQ